MKIITPVPEVKQEILLEHRLTSSFLGRFFMARRIIDNEMGKSLLILWDYKFNLFTQVFTMVILFIGLSFFVGNGFFNQNQLPGLLLGYIVWFYARVVIKSSSIDMIGEAQAGTLEQMYMSPAPAGFLLLGRLLALLISTSLTLLLPTLGLVFFLNIHIPIRWEALPVFLLTLLGLFGFTLVLSGVGLIFKQITALADFIQDILLFLTGAIIPISFFPSWLGYFARTLPITQGIVVLRNIELKGQSLRDVWINGSIIWLIIHSSLYFCAGWFVFKWCERIAKQRGSLGQY